MQRACRTPALPLLPATVLAVGFCLAVPRGAAADTAAAPREPSAAAGGRLETIVVTASRVAETADEALAPVTVVTREDVERLQAGSVQDVLRGLPGVAVTNSGGRGQPTSLFLRGAESDHVLVLIDGVRAGSATAGTFSLEHVPVDLVERIEVVRGPRASLYGSDAIGGVVQIFTRKGGGTLAPFGRVTGGSRGTADVGAGISGGGDRAWFSVTGSAAREDGFNACDGYGAPLFFGCFTEEPDRDGFRNAGVSARAGYRFPSGAEIDGRVLHDRSDVEFDGSSQNASEARQSVYAATLAGSPRPGWRTTLTVGRSHDDLDFFRGGEFDARFVTRRDEVTLQNDVDLGESHLFTAGLDHRRDRVSGTTEYAVSKRGNRGVFAQLLGVFGDHEVQLSARRDDDRQFGGANTGGVAWGWQLHEAARLTASYGTAFKAPTFNELYWPGYGNEALRPEESSTVDLGVTAGHGPASWSVNVFRNEIEDLIAHDADIGKPNNVRRARIHGLEAALGTRVRGFDLDASLTWLDPRNRDAANRGKQLARRPRRAARIDVDRPFGRYRVGGTVHAEGARYDDLANTRRIGGFHTVDLRAAYEFGGAWSVEGKIENLFDEDYETASGYNQPGRGFFLTLRYRP